MRARSSRSCATVLAPSGLLCRAWTRRLGCTTQAKLPGVEYLHDEVGYNFRLTNVAAAPRLLRCGPISAAASLKWERARSK